PPWTADERGSHGHRLTAEPARGAPPLPARQGRRPGLSVGGLLGQDVAAEVHERLDRFCYERRGVVRVGERVRAGGDRAAVARIDLRLDHAGASVVDRAQARDRAAVALRVAREELPGLQLGLGAHEPVRDSAGAVSEEAAIWATTSRSANPLISWTSVSGRR